MTTSERKGLGGFDKVLIGCGIGCAVLILAVVFAVAFGTLWVFTPGQQAATDAIADDSSLGVVRLHELADDEGTQELFTRVLARVDEVSRERQREELPDGLRWLSDLQAQQSNPAGLNMLIPKEMTVAFEQAADGEGVDWVVAFNPRTMVRALKAILSLASRGDEDPQLRSQYLEHDTYRFEEDAHLAFVGSTVLFASSRIALERAIDRIESGAPGVSARTDGALAASIPEGDWDFEGVVGSEAGLLEGLLALGADPAPEEGAGEGVPEPAAFEDLHLAFGLDVVSSDEITGETVLECGEAPAAERWLAVVEARSEALRQKAVARGLEFEIASRVEGSRVRTELRLVGLEELLVAALTYEEEGEEEEGEAGEDEDRPVE